MHRYAFIPFYVIFLLVTLTKKMASDVTSMQSSLIYEQIQISNWQLYIYVGLFHQHISLSQNENNAF